MEYHQIKFLAASKKNLNQKNFNQTISSGINFCLMFNEETKKLHKSNTFKGYTFYIREFFPINMGQTFHLIIKCYGDHLANLLKEALLQRDNDSFFCEKIEEDLRFEYSSMVKRLAMKTISPVVSTELWDDFSDKEKLIEILGRNIIGKYNSIFKTNETENPICEAKVIGSKLSVVDYKGGHIAGRKLLIKFKPDNLSQKMAFVAMSYGIGEKNTLGFGTCFANNEYLYQF